MEKIKDKDEYLTLTHYKEPLKEVTNGFGYIGALCSTLDGDKLQCHLCGELYRCLDKHIFNTHNMKVDEYREKFELARTTALISETIREERKQRTLLWIAEQDKKYGKNWRERLVAQGRAGALKRSKGQPKVRLETKNKRGVCPDQLIAKIQEVAKKLNHTPSKNDFIRETGGQRYVHLIYATFGSWTTAVTKANLKAKVVVQNGGRRNYNGEELLEFLSDFYRNQKKIPTETDCRRGLIPPSSTYRSYFGSLPKARELAGILEIPTRWGVLA